MTVAVRDALIPENKQELIAQADEKVAQIKRQYDRGLISDDVRYDRVIKVWNDTTEMVKKELSTTFGERNPIYMFADSRCARLYGADPSAGRYARTDCKYLR